MRRESRGRGCGAAFDLLGGALDFGRVPVDPSLVDFVHRGCGLRLGEARSGEGASCQYGREQRAGSMRGLDAVRLGFSLHARVRSTMQ